MMPVFGRYLPASYHFALPLAIAQMFDQWYLLSCLRPRTMLLHEFVELLPTSHLPDIFSFPQPFCLARDDIGGTG